MRSFMATGWMYGSGAAVSLSNGRMGMCSTHEYLSKFVTKKLNIRWDCAVCLPLSVDGAAINTFALGLRHR